MVAWWGCRRAAAWVERKVATRASNKAVQTESWKVASKGYPSAEKWVVESAASMVKNLVTQ